MNDLTNENEQWEAIKTWWRQNGKTIIVMFIIAISLGFGWRYWQSQRLEKQEQASQLFDQLLSAQIADLNSPMIPRIASEIEQSYPHTVYAPLAALLEAKLAATKGDLTTAEEKLRWSLEHTKNKELTAITQIRLARVLLANKKPDQALVSLENVKDKSFFPAVEQVKGDIYLVQGQTAKARAAYQNAFNTMPASQPLRVYVEMQLNRLPSTVPIKDGSPI